MFCTFYGFSFLYPSSFHCFKGALSKYDQQYFWSTWHRFITRQVMEMEMEEMEEMEEREEMEEM